MAKDRQPGDYAAGKGAVIKEVVRCSACKGKGEVDGKTCTICFGDGLIPSSNSHADRKKRDRR